MKSLIQNQVLTYLREHNVMTLATMSPEGPWAASVFYVNDEFNLYFLSAPATRHSTNLKLNSKVSVTIQEDYREWSEIKGIQLAGNAYQLEKGEVNKVIVRYNEKFPIIGKQAPREIVTALSKVAWYRVDPERLYFIDNALGLGHREEIFLN
ncbi:MAG: pyridoxamine 5'-phosphate oxidase family protein [SAR324 cluster bacterium]|nr:pyridoxamine 5'-phosphate oxidase family protein [SAR324 cluster bacterium]